VACAALFALWRHPTPPKSRPHLPLLFLAVICASVAWQAQGTLTKTAASREPQRAPVVVTEAKWADSVWRNFPCYRSDMSGDRREPITVQWAAKPQQIEAQLRSRGWLEGNRLTMRSVLSLVSPDVTAMDLPVLPTLNNGEPSKLVFSRSREVRDERDVLRFWPTGYALAGREGAPPVPIWLGSLVHERLRRPSWPFNILHADKQMDRLTSDRDTLPEWRRLEIASDFGCEGVPVTLLTSDAK
jgi:undecaprenyl-diphosphatase